MKLRTGGSRRYQEGRLVNFFLLPQSESTETLVNSTIFNWDGDVREGKPHGPGTCLYKDRSIHIGEFQSGRLIRGTIIFFDGQIMTGDFNRGKLTDGEWIIPGKKIFKGTLSNNQPLNGWIKRFTGERQQIKDGRLVKTES